MRNAHPHRIRKRSPRRRGQTRRTVLASIAVALATLATACSTPQSSEDDTTVAGEQQLPLRIGISSPVQTLDLSRYKGQTDLLVGDLIFDTLVAVDEQLEVVPRLATEWSNPDPLTYEFTLRQGVRFHDGAPLTSEDVKAQFDTALELSNLASWTEPIASVAASADTVTFTLKHPSPSFLVTIANAPFGIQSPASLAAGEQTLATAPVGTGPYRLVSWQGDVISLERNDDYWGEAPTQSAIEITTVSDNTTRYNGLESGEFDIIQNVDPFQFSTLDDNDLVGLSAPYAQTVWLLLTATNPLLEDVRVRQAIALALDTEAITQTATEGLFRPATGFIPPELGEVGIAPHVPDLEQARRLLAEAGYPDGLTIPLYTTNGRYVGDATAAEVVQAQLAEVGITADITVYEYAGMLDVLGKPEAGLAITGYTNRPTPDTLLTRAFTSDGSFNLSTYSNSEFDELMAQAGAQPDAESAWPQWAEADRLLVEDVAGVPIYWANSLFATSSEIAGFTVDPLGQIHVNGVVRTS